MKYVALLRGINVGGNSKIEMKRLKNVCESLEFENVQTYINSGNVLFETTKDKKQIAQAIEEAIVKEFGFVVPVVVKNSEAIRAIDKEVPKTWVNNTEMKTDVLFLWDEIDDKNIIKDLIVRPEIDNIKYIQGAIIWNVKRADVTKSGLLKIIGTDLYKKVTVRNINTVRKLHELLNIT